MRDGTATARYALYFAPEPGSAWDSFGAGWLGRSAATGELRDQPAIPGLDVARFRTLTQAPRRYGFHATLKAPFRLTAGCTPEQLLRELRAVFCDRRIFAMPRMRAVLLGDFLALVPGADEPRINRIAEDCVGLFDRYRAPPSQAEIERRGSAGLTPGEKANLLRWGYPCVMESFRFHMSLTGPLTPIADHQIRALIDAAAGLIPDEPLRFDAVALFREASPGADFLIAGRACFEGRG